MYHMHIGIITNLILVTLKFTEKIIKGRAVIISVHIYGNIRKEKAFIWGKH